MINQLSRNLRSQHLLIFILFIILAMAATGLHNHISANSTTFSLPAASLNSSEIIPVPLAIPKLTAANAMNPENNITQEPTVISTSTRIQPNPITVPKTIDTHVITTPQLNLDSTSSLKISNLVDNPSLAKPAITATLAKQDKAISLPTAWQTVLIHHGDTLSRIFSRLSISYNDLQAIMHLPLANNNLKRIQPGQKMEFLFNHQRQLEQIKFAFNDISTLVIARDGEHYTAKVNNKPLESRTIFKEFIVSGSIASSMSRAGLTPGLYAELHQIFHSSLNFATGVRKGDQFDILYQEYYLHGQKYKPGHILLASFKGHSNHLTALRYTDPKGNSNFYTPDGAGLQAMFLASPLQYKYISSYFSLHRLDPYLHRYHPHLGVDYAAAKGTPIHSVGDGTIAYRGWSIGYGNTIIIKYGGTYKALYGHMSRFASNLSVGQHVNKGQVIGYVGRTGWATGDHLHFGWYVNGIPKDPLKYTADATMPIPAAYRRAFLAESKLLLDQLELNRSTQFAENKTDNIDRRS